MGPDGNLWYTNPSEETINYLIPGTGNAFHWNPAVPASQCSKVPKSKLDCPFVDAIVAGADGAMWFSESKGARSGACRRMACVPNTRPD